jgi:predicted RNA-binding Zn-ribbon protein involved in translation (DUF1610 family)
MKNKKFVYIKDKHATEYNEVYTMFYKCPACGDNEIAKWHSYCPTCGVKLIVKVTKLCRL